MTRALVGALLLFLGACGGVVEEGGYVEAKYRPVHGDITFTAEERHELERGAAFITGHVPWHPVVIVWDAPHAGEGCPVGTLQRSPDGKGARTFPDGCIVVGVQERWPGRITEIVAHEFGHLVGLGHTRTGLMTPAYNDLSWTDDVERECERVGACAKSNVPPAYTGTIDAY